MVGVVVGVDESETALGAAQRAAALASAVGEPLHLVMAMKPGSSEVIQSGNDRYFVDWVSRARGVLTDIARQIGAPEATKAIGGSDPAKAICAEAARLDASLIVVGNRRVQGVKRLLGSVATEVLRHAPCDVLVVETTSVANSSRAGVSGSHNITSAKAFRFCTKEQKVRVEGLATAIQVPAGRLLTSQGQEGREFGVILDGSATVGVDGAPVATLGPGDHFGEIALLASAGVAKRPRSATVTADVDLWIAVMSIAEFQTMIAELPDIANRLRRSAAARLEDNNAG